MCGLHLRKIRMHTKNLWCCWIQNP